MIVLDFYDLGPTASKLSVIVGRVKQPVAGLATDHTDGEHDDVMT